MSKPSYLHESGPSREWSDIEQVFKVDTCIETMTHPTSEIIDILSSVLPSDWKVEHTKNEKLDTIVGMIKIRYPYSPVDAEQFERSVLQTWKLFVFPNPKLNYESEIIDFYPTLEGGKGLKQMITPNRRGSIDLRSPVVAELILTRILDDVKRKNWERFGRRPH